MRVFRRVLLWPVIAGFVILAAGCIVEPAHDDVWCANHPYKCNR
jgi:hypothetical protein